MAPKQSGARPWPWHTGRNQPRATTTSTSTAQKLPQNAPTVTKLPRPAVWEPVDLRDVAGLTVDNPDYFDRVDERLAHLFDRRPEGWSTHQKTETASRGKVVPKQKLEDLARTHAYYSRLKVFKQKVSGSSWSDEASFDDTWHAERFLGAGTFGRVGLWVRRDDKNQIVDEMAIKEENYHKQFIWAGGIPEEAVHNEFMNRGGVENIQRLRGFKSFATPPDNPVLKYQGGVGDRRWRYYLEYAPHGSLQRLIARYRAWNQYLPESFLWHVFDGLAQVLVTFDETVPNPKEHKIGKLRDADRLVHFDIKPDNIFLGYEQPFDSNSKKYGGHQSNVYPIVKIGDFGVATMTSEKDKHQQSGLFWGRGTQYYFPPELSHYGTGFPVPPNGRYLPLQDEQGNFITIEAREAEGNPWGTVFTQPMNVWGIAKVMYDLATLSQIYHYAGISTQLPDEYERWGKNAIEKFQRDPFHVSNRARFGDPAPSPYTEDLMNLIEKCMKPAAKDRIKAREIKGITETMLAKYGSGDGLDMNEKVYYAGNEINNMQPGPENFPPHNGPSEIALRQTPWSEMDGLMDYSVNPDEPELKPPRWAIELRRYKADERKERVMPYNKYWEENCRIANGQVFFQPKSTITDSSETPDDQNVDQNGGRGLSTNDAPGQDDDSSDEPPVEAPKPKASSKQPAGKTSATAGKGEVKKGGKGQKKATGGAGVKKLAAPKPTGSKPAAKKDGPKKAAAQAVSTTTNDASQAQADPPTRTRLPRAAKADVAKGKYKV